MLEDDVVLLTNNSNDLTRLAWTGSTFTIIQDWTDTLPDGRFFNCTISPTEFIGVSDTTDDIYLVQLLEGVWDYSILSEYPVGAGSYGVCTVSNDRFVVITSIDDKITSYKVKRVLST